MSTMLYSAELEEVESGTPQVPTTDTGHLREGQSTKLGSKSLKFGTLVGVAIPPRGKFWGPRSHFGGVMSGQSFNFPTPSPKLGCQIPPKFGVGVSPIPPTKDSTADIKSYRQRKKTPMVRTRHADE